VRGGEEEGKNVRCSAERYLCWTIVRKDFEMIGREREYEHYTL